MALLDRVAAQVAQVAQPETKAWSEPPFWALPELRTGWVGSDREAIESSFEAYVSKAYKENGIVFACVLARLLPFSEARFQWQELVGGRPGKLFGTPELALLETPWPNGTTGDLLARMEQKASLAGNWYGTVVGSGASRRVREMRPDWVTIVTGVRDDVEASPWDLDAEIVGYIYDPVIGGRRRDPVLLTPDQVVHYAPIPDPLAQWRGMSWLTPVVREINADSMATRHKETFFSKGAQLNVVVRYDKGIRPADYERYVELFDRNHAGPRNAYKTLHLGGGADVTVVGGDMKQVDFKAVQGAGETRIAAAAGVGAIIARFSEGLAGSSLNAGNYQAAKRQFADMTLRPLWRNAAASLAKLVTSPGGGARLWYDDRDIPFLAEDAKDLAEVLSKNAQTIKALVDAGYSPDAVVAAVEAGDLSRLAGQHTGLYSVQLQRPGEGGQP